MLRVTGIKLSIDKDAPLELEKALLRKLKIKAKDLLEYRIFKKSIDARNTDRLYFVYTVDAKVKNEAELAVKLKDPAVTTSPDLEYKFTTTGTGKLKHRPVIAGTGPAGLFCGLILAQMGYRPILLERGSDVDTRIKVVNKFWRTGVLDPECNVQFGEGGAGTFSDGKLTTLIKDKRCRKVLEEFVRAGAPEEILYIHKPHVGTDKLRTVVKNLRNQITKLGGEIRFNSKVTDLNIKEGKITGIIINGHEEMAAGVLVLAIGHSARDTFEMLYTRKVNLKPKAFSIGVRIEHPQELINKAQYKKFAGHEKLGAADYKLVYHSPTGRSAYTFCMCPGGVVVAAASENNSVVTNGMSEYARNAPNANSALLVGVTPEDYPTDHPLAGVYFQRTWERKAFELGGGNYNAPAQLVGDFLANKPSTSLGSVTPSYKKAVQLTGLKDCLPDYVITTLKEAIIEFDKKLQGFALPDAVLTGVETRSSSPVRITRDEQFEANIRGLYPAGEGAGYAGGIISAAVDGIKTAEAIAQKYMPIEP
ncbi:NAD(P)/FAD-dependent oxidoreductase [Desulfolucanica intricata]|uniref:NAD(P)/FAD-dependent oxidoreductase n=1 Tax=Desulfolucanica intricata TaxID=1285191 RepID=UPI00082BF299|nr:hypothetical protein [Desulfolucanica intricata]